jgi:hypothetical protein
MSKSWNIQSRTDYKSVRIIHNLNPIKSLDEAIKECKKIRAKLPHRIFEVVENTIGD